MKRYRVCVVGAGWSGLAAAIHAVQAGHRVTVLEASRSLGGRARTLPASADGLPPPPPEEPWIQQLANLPGSGSTPPGLLRVPLSPQVLARPPATPTTSTPPRPAASSAPLPQLVGVVGAAGKAASAIFLVGGSSMSVGSGETIGSSGWRLRSAAGETALIERGDELRQVSIINGF